MNKNRYPETGVPRSMPHVGICVSLSRNPATMLLLRAIGLDFVHIDLERSTLSSEVAADMIFAARAANIQPAVRLSAMDFALAQRLSQTTGVDLIVSGSADRTDLQVFAGRCAASVEAVNRGRGEVAAALGDASQIDWIFSLPGITTVELDVSRLSDDDQRRAVDAARAAGSRFAVNAESLSDLERWAQEDPAWITFSSDREIIGAHMARAMVDIRARH